ncbi:MAG: xanthine dehydrogenase family protein molybdopterin-binding subunit [Acidobacteria bacterium]|nr:MAG: xanthine dehydrogenase family protein molybdopterin-binding subunit [Acidobacteriota bacterium]
MRKTVPQFIGAPVKRREDPALITGEGKFVADIELAAAATMAFVRSPYAHAKVKKIDASEALAIPGVLTVYTAADLNPLVSKPFPFLTIGDGGHLTNVYEQKRFPLASDKVRHVGDPVAVVIADDPYIAVDAVEAVSVDYEPLAVVTETDQALSEGAPLIHEDCSGNRAFDWSLDGGDIEGAFAKAHTSVELRADIQRLVPNAMEPRAVAASFDDEGGYTLWTTTQIPHQIRDFLAGMLEIDPKRFRVIAPEVGGGFGAKCNVYGEEVLAVLLAHRLRRAVRWTASRTEDYLVTSHGRDQEGVLRLAADENGRVLGADLTLTMDCGAYFSRVTPIIPALTGVMMTGVYDIPNVRARATGVFTNKVMSEPYRGAGRPEAAYFLERAMDLLADELELDPVELRRRNFIAPDRFPYETATGLTYDSGDYDGALDELLKHVDLDQVRKEQAQRRQDPSAKLLGVGIACYVEICGFGPWELGSVRVAADGKVTVLSGTSPHGQGHATSWAQITADTLQVPLEDIEVIHGDTKIVPKGIGTFGSRSAPVGGAAVHESSETVREGAAAIAAHLLEAAPADIRLKNGTFHVVGSPGRRVGWSDVRAAAYAEDLPEELSGKLSASTQFTPRGDTFPFGAHACIVEIDPGTGEIAILRFISVDDCGKVINPLLVTGQIHGGLAQGIGQALWEGAVYDDGGNLVTGNLMEYAVPRADLLPSYESYRTETPTPLNALGVKGIGEAATIGSTPAVVNAVVDALSHLGVKHVDTPLTPEKIWKLIS